MIDKFDKILSNVKESGFPYQPTSGSMTWARCASGHRGEEYASQEYCGW